MGLFSPYIQGTNGLDECLWDACVCFCLHFPIYVRQKTFLTLTFFNLKLKMK